MIMKTEIGFKRLDSMSNLSIPIKVKKKTVTSNLPKKDDTRMMPVMVLDFTKINKDLTIQYADGKEYYIDPSIEGAVRVDNKLILITDQCEMTCQYRYELGYELLVYCGGEVAKMVSLSRSDLKRAETRRTEYLYEFVGNNIDIQAVRINALMLKRRYDIGIKESSTYAINTTSAYKKPTSSGYSKGKQDKFPF